jgi:hypothetical protein
MAFSVLGPPLTKLVLETLLALEMENVSVITLVSVNLVIGVVHVLGFVLADLKILVMVMVCVMMEPMEVERVNAFLTGPAVQERKYARPRPPTVLPIVANVEPFANQIPLMVSNQPNVWMENVSKLAAMALFFAQLVVSKDLPVPNLHFLVAKLSILTTALGTTLILPLISKQVAGGLLDLVIHTIVIPTKTIGV